MPHQEDIESQLKLLAAYRQTLAIYLRQRALLGEAYTPPGVLNSITESQLDIQRLKAILRNWRVEIEDLPDDGDSITAQVRTPLQSHETNLVADSDAVEDSNCDDISSKSAALSTAFAVLYDEITAPIKTPLDRFILDAKKK
ncbi:MAG: hypothetical protein IPP13_03425 [Kouleothrix sp.]|jgi:hypothetical protein|nr:hypothetical protein [Kouleothrix sp.]